ncbi:MAG: CoA transferase subunit A [Solirubrobacteraceae bacterium]
MSENGKLVPLEQAAELVRDGELLAIGGLSLNCAPMSFCRELARAGRRDLQLLAVVSGMAVDWLIAAGCVRRLIMGLTSFEGFGLAPSFRAAAQSGSIEVQEWSEHTLICALQAATAGVPFVPTRAGLGTDMPALHPDRTWEAVDERSGKRYLACAAIEPDVAVIHVHEADARGNARMNPKLVWFDTELVKAAKKVVITAERIVETDAFRAAPERTSVPGFAVDHVVHAPRGAWPTACWPEYRYDGDFYRAYQRAARDPGSFAKLFSEHVAPLRIREDAS